MSDRRLMIFEDILRQIPPQPLVDLGAGHCKFSRIAYCLGFPVTSIDARSERVPTDIDWPFIQEDIRHTDLHPYGIVCILGLLHHLWIEDQMDLLWKCRGKLVIVDAHCARKDDLHVGYYKGAEFQETNTPTSSWGNEISFWHTEDSLRLLFDRHGFDAEKILPEHAPLRAFWLLRPRL